MNHEIRELVTDVMDGNPGAYTIIRKLMILPTWYQLLCHLRNSGYIGSELWRVVKDDYDHNWAQFVKDQLAQMPPERADTLRTLTFRRDPHYN